MDGIDFWWKRISSLSLVSWRWIIWIGIQGTHDHIFHLALVGVCCKVMMSAMLVIVPCTLIGISFCSKLKDSIFTWTIVVKCCIKLIIIIWIFVFSKRYHAWLFFRFSSAVVILLCIVWQKRCWNIQACVAIEVWIVVLSLDLVFNYLWL